MGRRSKWLEGQGESALRVSRSFWGASMVPCCTSTKVRAHKSTAILSGSINNDNLHAKHMHMHMHMRNPEAMECNLTTENPSLPTLSARQGTAFPCSGGRKRESDRGQRQRILRGPGSGEIAHAPKQGIHPGPRAISEARFRQNPEFALMHTLNLGRIRRSRS